MDKRELGRTGEKLSMIGFGGIAVSGEEQSAANRLVAQAVEERGINYFDVSRHTATQSRSALGTAML